MPLSEDPARLSKSRLRSDLVAHNVALPPANSNKEVYVELHLRHIERKSAAEFSSDEEDRVQEEPDKVEDADHPGVPDPSTLTDDDLKTALLRHGAKVGPVVASTRAVYERKLRKLLQADGCDEQANGEEENAVLYSDSEDEKDEFEGDKEETAEQSEQSQQEMSQMERRRSVSDTELSGSDVQEHRSRSGRRHLLAVDQHAVRNQTLFYTPEVSPHKPGIKPPVEPVNSILKDIFPAQASPTGISATRRRPIKGAAGRPVQYGFPPPETPTSPTTQQRREVERRLVPIHIQIIAYLVVVLLLFLIYVFAEESFPDSVMSLLESPNQASEQE